MSESDEPGSHASFTHSACRGLAANRAAAALLLAGSAGLPWPAGATAGEAMSPALMWEMCSSALGRWHAATATSAAALARIARSLMMFLEGCGSLLCWRRCLEMSGGRRPLASVSGGEVEDLLHRTVCLADGVAVVRRAGEVRVREGDAAMRLIAEHVARCRFAPHAEEKAGLGIHVCVTPAIEDDTCDVATWVEAARREHVSELLA